MISRNVERAVGKQRQDHEAGGAIQLPHFLESNRPLILIQEETLHYMYSFLLVFLIY